MIKKNYEINDYSNTKFIKLNRKCGLYNIIDKKVNIFIGTELIETHSIRFENQLLDAITDYNDRLFILTNKGVTIYDQDFKNHNYVITSLNMFDRLILKSNYLFLTGTVSFYFLKNRILEL